ncbi:MAG: AmmeMemoRadiSam system protein B [Bradymonadaceae bacterium]
MKETTREPACPGRFYPAAADTLRRDVTGYLADAEGSEDRPPRAIIAPHAGYPFSGAIAGHAFATLTPRADAIERALLIGPSHFVEFDGLAAAPQTHFATPLESTTVARDVVETLVDDGLAEIDSVPHAREHSLETHLPFLQHLADGVEIIPIVTGRDAGDGATRLIASALADEGTIVSVSSDLSHYLDYATARQVDDKTRRAIESLRPDDLDDQQACGHTAIRGLLRAARDRDMTVETLAMANSGDTSGDKSRVVGYGAWAFY